MSDKANTSIITPELQKLWDETEPAIECPAFINAAFDGCIDVYGYDISVLSSEEKTAIFIASLDAENEGRSEEAAAEMLLSLAVAGEWDHHLTGSR